VMGGAARAMRAEVVAGHDDAAALAELARGHLRTKLAAWEQARTGRLGAPQRFMLGQPLARIDGLAEPIAAVGEPIAARLAPFASALTRRDAIPGSGRWSAAVMLAAIGTDLSRFPPAGPLARWAGRGPGHDERGGQRRSGRTRQGRPWRRVTLTAAADAAGRSQDTVRSARSHRLIARRGKQTAAIAVGRTILERCHLRLTTGQCYDDQQARARPDRQQATEQDRLVRRLEQLGHRVTLEPAA